MAGGLWIPLPFGTQGVGTGSWEHPWVAAVPLPPLTLPSTHCRSASSVCEDKTGNLPCALGSWKLHPQTLL